MLISRLTGKALSLIGSRNVESWADIKGCLMLNFQDQRTEDCLVADVMNIRPNRNETPYNFGMRIKDSLNLLCSKITLTEQDAARLDLKSKMYGETALQAYLRGLVSYGLLGDKVRYQKPDSLEKAMALVLEEENFAYSCGRTNALNVGYTLQKQQAPVFQKPKVQNSIPHVRQNPVNFPPRNAYNQFMPNTFTQANQFIPNQLNQGNQSMPSYYNRNNPSTSNNFGTNYSRQNVQTSYYKPPSFKFAKSPGQLQNNRISKPTPMDVSVQRTHTYSNPRPPQVAELHQQIPDDEIFDENYQVYYPLLESDNSYVNEGEEAHVDSELQDEYDDYEQLTQNFREPASNNLPNT